MITHTIPPEAVVLRDRAGAWHVLTRAVLAAARVPAAQQAELDRQFGDDTAGSGAPAPTSGRADPAVTAEAQRRAVGSTAAIHHVQGDLIMNDSFTQTAQSRPASERAALRPDRPQGGLSLLPSRDGPAAGTPHRTTRQLGGEASTDAPDPEVDAMVARAVTAQRAFAGWPEERVDALLRDVAQRIADHAEELAAATVAETGIGNVADKATKNRLASQSVYRSLAGKPGAGLLRVNQQRRIAEIASPMGVVFGLVPRTNPVATFVFKVLIALKARNALIVSCHRDAQGVGQRTGELIAAVLARHGAPAHLVQWVRGRAGRQTTLQFMRHRDVAFILATGGAGMVRAAYSSGTPAIGVGPGNAPAWVCADADLDLAAEAIIASKSFDNGIICASEHNLVVDHAVQPAFVAALERWGAAVLRPDEVGPVIEAAFDPAGGHVRSHLIGQSAAVIAEVAGIRRAGTIRLIVVPASIAQACGPLGREKLAPIVSLFTVRDDDEGFALCRQLLANEGAGHTAIIHTANEARIERFGREMPASRILVNAPGAQGTMGLGTGLALSLTLGCGTFGGTSTTDGVTYTHLLNIKRVAYATPNDHRRPPQRA